MLFDERDATATLEPKYTTTIRMNLQHFADGDGGGTVDQSPVSESTVSTTAEQPVMSPSQIFEQQASKFFGEQQPESTTTEQATTSETEEPNSAVPQVEQAAGADGGESLILGKYKSVGQLVDAYRNQQSHSTRVAQENAQLKAAVQAYSEQLASLKTAQPATQTGTEPTATPATAASAEFDLEEFNERYYENPAQAVIDLAKDIATKTAEQVKQDMMQQIKPIQERDDKAARDAAWAQTVQKFSGEHSDLNEFLDDMGQYLQSKGLRGLSDPNQINAALGEALTFAKGARYDAKAAVNPAALANDENFINTHILTNQAIRDRIIRENMAQIKGVATTMPKQINSEGSPSPASVTKRPTTMEESHNLFASLIGMK